MSVLKLLVVGVCLCVLSQPARSGGEPGQKEGPIPTVWIYRNMPGANDQDNRGKPERYFEPFWFFPATKTKDIIVDIKKPAYPDLDAREDNKTCIEYSFFNLAAGDFAGAGFVPEGTLNTEKPPLNIADGGPDSLLIGGRSVFLKFRVRARDKDTVKVRFEACGLSSGALVDGIRPSQTPKPDLTIVTEKWKDITIDLSRRSAGLEKLACPLKVIVRADDNPGKMDVSVYVDDIRFEVGSK